MNSKYDIAPAPINKPIWPPMSPEKVNKEKVIQAKKFIIEKHLRSSVLWPYFKLKKIRESESDFTT